MPTTESEWRRKRKRLQPRMLRVYLHAAAMAILVGIAPSAVSAQSPQDIAWCKGQDNPTTEQQIRGCTAAIEAAGREGRDLALFYLRRAAAYLERQDFDSALHDFGEGLKLDANTAAADFFDR